MDHKLEKIKKILQLSPEREVDNYALKNLKNRLYKWKNAEVEYLSNLEYFINGKKFDSLIDAFYEIEELDKLKIKFLEPNLEGDWHFSKPTKELKEMSGKGVCETFDYDPSSLDKWAQAKRSNLEKVMIRGFMSDFFVPISINKKSEYHYAEEMPRQYDPHLTKLSDLWKDVRDGVIPFVMRFCLYTKKERYNLLIDPINDKLKPHPLGDVTRIKKVDRDPVDYLMFDKVFAWVELPILLKKILELLFETQEMSVFDIADCLNMDKNVAENNLESLEHRDFVTKNKDIYYEINIDKIKEVAEKLD